MRFLQKKSHIKSVMHTLTLYAGTEEEISKIQTELSKFSRQPNEGFPEAISRFDSLYYFLEQLKRSVEKQELSLLTLNTLKMIAPYLIEQKAAKIYGSWIQESIP